MKSWLRTFWSRTWAALRTDRLDRDFDEELTTHLELLIDEGRARGLSRAEARREALRRLGRPESLREDHRDQRGVPLLDALALDVRYAVRMLRKAPAFTAVVTISLALGIGANTALFSVVDGLLLRSLPVRDPDRLVHAMQVLPAMGIRKKMEAFPKRTFDEVRAHTDIVSALVGFRRLDRPVVAIDGSVEPSRQVDRVSDNFFRELGVAPILGRAPDSSDAAVAIISDRLWRDRFEGSPSVLGRLLTIDGRGFEIVGVAPRQFLGLSLESATEIWTSAATPTDLQMIVRLQPGVTHTQAQAAMQVFFPQPPQLPRDLHMEVEVFPAGKGLSQLRAQYERPLLALVVLVTLVLLTTCTNVGNLLMLRHTARRRELTVRAALGARRSRLMMQYLVESLMLAAMGGLLALAFARWGVAIILSMLPLPAFPEGLRFQADARTLGFAAGLSLLSALLFGLAPAWRAAHVDLTGALRSSQTGTPTRTTRRLGRLLVACQVGLSVLLLVGAGLFVQTLRNLTRHDVGFNPDRLLQVLIDTRFAGYREGQVGAVYRLLLERVSAIPGVQSVTGIRNPIMRHSLSRAVVTLPGLERGPDESWDAADVGPFFFETLGIPVLRGRTFTAADFAQEGPVYVVNEAFVKRYYPNEDPVARQIGIIGVVGDVKVAGVRAPGGPMMYMLSQREPDRLNALEVRAAGDPEAIVPAIREELRRINPRLLVDIRTMRQEIDRDIARERMVAAISGFFSVLGLLLASIGIFGVASYSVAQRTPELGIRMALGAGRWSLVRESMGDTVRVFGIGLIAGIVAAIAAVRLASSFMADLLFGLIATDAANLAGAVAVMVAVALAACVLPARRATRIDPLIAIRCD